MRPKPLEPQTWLFGEESWENTMEFGKGVSRVVVHTFPLMKQRPVDNVIPVPLFAFNDQGDQLAVNYRTDAIRR
jgi:hypothetical protein